MTPNEKKEFNRIKINLKRNGISSYKEFREKYPQDYLYSKRKYFLHEFKLGKVPNGYWKDKKLLKKIARKYRSKTVFQEELKSAFFYAKKLGIYKEITEHMVSVVNGRRTSYKEEYCRTVIEHITKKEFKKKRIKTSMDRHMELDGFNEELNIAFEYHGRQHFKYNSKFHKTRDNFKKQKERDQHKREYCKSKKILLIEISYDKKIDEIYDYLVEVFVGLGFKKPKKVDIKKMITIDTDPSFVKYSKAASKCLTRTEFRAKYPSEYVRAFQLGIDELICSHMKNPKRGKKKGVEKFWTEDKIKEEFGKYCSITELRKKNSKLAAAYENLFKKIKNLKEREEKRSEIFSYLKGSLK